MHVSQNWSSSTVNTCIFLCFVFIHVSLMAFRSLIHRLLTPFFPVLRLMGSVPGERKSALSLLKSGFWVAVMPGNCTLSSSNFNRQFHTLL